MAKVNFDLLLTDLKRDEGFKPYVYDDANGHAIVPGYTLVGNPTIGYGWCVSTEPCTEELGAYILEYQATDKYNELVTRFPWVVDLSEPRARALLDMAFNLGVDGLSKFTTFLAMLKANNFQTAADDLKTTLWAKQVGLRALRIEALIKSND